MGTMREGRRETWGPRERVEGEERGRERSGEKHSSRKTIKEEIQKI